jgi:hypothetical protein
MTSTQLSSHKLSNGGSGDAGDRLLILSQIATSSPYNHLDTLD